MTTAPLPVALDPVSAAWLAGGSPRAVDVLLVSRVESGRARVVDGHVVDRGLDRGDRLDALLLDALGARGRRDVETVRWRLQRDHRLADLREPLLADGLLTGRTALGLRDRAERPARTAAGRRLLRRLHAAPPPGAVWEVALHGRDGLTDPSLRTALLPPVRPAAAGIPAPRRSWRWSRDPGPDTHLYAGGATYTGFTVGGLDGGGGGGGCGDGGGGC